MSAGPIGCAGSPLVLLTCRPLFITCNSLTEGCRLRLASHAKPGHVPSRRLVQRRPTLGALFPGEHRRCCCRCKCRLRRSQATTSLLLLLTNSSARLRCSYRASCPQLHLAAYLAVELLPWVFNALGQIDQDTFDAIHALCHSLGSRLWVGELATDDASAGKPAANNTEDCKRFCLAANEQRRKFSSKSCSLASPAGRSDWRRPVSTNSTSTPAAATATR